MSDFMLGMSGFTKGVAVFISYAEKDKELLESLRSQLNAYQLQGLMTIWDGSKVEPGREIEQEILDHLNTAEIILLLISPSFLGSDRCLQQMQHAMRRWAIREIRVIPVLVRPTAGWQDMPFGKLAPLPADGTAVTNISNPEQAFHDIASSVCVISKQFLSRRKDRDLTSDFDDHRYLQNFGPYSPVFSGKGHSPTPTYGNIMGFPPPHDPPAILQRENLVKEIYTKLSEPDITTIVLTGIAGIGKSTLASLLYFYAEKQRRACKGIFSGEALWLKFRSGYTLTNLAFTLFRAMGWSMPNFDNRDFVAQNVALELFNALKMTAEPCLIVLDQFDAQLDLTGTAQAGMDEWLDILNSHSCPCRILLTCCPYPQGTRLYPRSRMQEILVPKLTISEGVKLLGQWGIQGKEAELTMIVRLYDGHPQALIGLHAFLQYHQTNDASLLANIRNAQLWIGSMSLFDQLSASLSAQQRELLLTFSIYRKAVLHLLDLHESESKSTSSKLLAKEVFGTIHSTTHEEISSRFYNILRVHLGEQEFIRLSTEVGLNIWQIVEQVLGESDDRENNHSIE